jgi:hypothetical protein
MNQRLSNTMNTFGTKAASIDQTVRGGKQEIRYPRSVLQYKGVRAMRRFLIAALMLAALSAAGASQAHEAWYGPPARVVRYPHHDHRVVIDDCYRPPVEVCRPSLVYQPALIPAPAQSYYQPNFVSFAGRNFAFQFGF